MLFQERMAHKNDSLILRWAYSNNPFFEFPPLLKGHASFPGCLREQHNLTGYFQELVPSVMKKLS